MSYRKIGGLHFVRLGRFSLSFCRCRRIDRAAIRAGWAARFLASLEE